MSESAPPRATTMRSGSCAMIASRSTSPTGKSFSTPLLSPSGAHAGKNSPFAAVVEATTGASIVSSEPVPVTVVETMRSGSAGISVVVPSLFSNVRGQSAAGASVVADASGVSDSAVCHRTQFRLT